MVSRFNFRAYIKPYNKIYKVQSIKNDGYFLAVQCFQEDGETLLKRNDNRTDLPIFTEGEFDLMQSTGHIDKNKKEVFDGDIVFDGAEYSIIEYNQERLRFQEYRKTSIDTINAYTLSHREVVGNIIENSDLAEKIRTLK